MSLMLYLFPVLAGIALLAWILTRKPQSTSTALAVGQMLPEFAAETEAGEPIDSTALRGARSVIVFVRGSWCPFCNEQVESLTEHYRQINAGGGRLVIVAPKPLETTRRVADVFGVEFEFWLDPELEAAKHLGLADPEAIPDRFQSSHGRYTIRPTVLVTDSRGVIRYRYISANPKDRPDPQRFMQTFFAVS